MAHIQFISWDKPESLPLFFQMFWPDLAYETQWNLLQKLRCHLMPYADSGPSMQPVRSLPTSRDSLSMTASRTPPHQQISSQLAGNATTSRSFLEPPNHARKSTTRDNQRLPVFEQLPNEPLAITRQRTHPQRPNRVVTTTASSPPNIPATREAKHLAKYPLLDASSTLELLAQPSRKSFQSPFSAEDVLEVLSQNLFSTAAFENTRAVIFESAAAFFENHGCSLKQSKDIIDIRTNDVDHVSAVNVKSCFIEVELRKDPKLEECEVNKFITAELRRGRNYEEILNETSRGTIARLNPRSTSMYEGHKITEELISCLKREGAPTSVSLVAIAEEGKSDQNVQLEILITYYLTYIYYKYHSCYYPEGCGAPSCHLRVKPAARPHEHHAEDFDGSDTQLGCTAARLPWGLNDDGIGNEHTQPHFFSLADTALRGHDVALVLPAAVPVRLFLSQSRKRPSCSDDVPFPMKKQKNALKLKSRTQSTIQPLERTRHDAPADDPYASAILSQPQTNANYETDPGLFGSWDDSDLYPPNEPLMANPEILGSWDDSDLHLPNEPLMANSEMLGSWDDSELHSLNEPLILA
ncbi:uncharacterized protein BBA_10256 [Beauveria bassiana ARSEF 2860]|uniref:Uncharacterized protein n=1 Tax=Beauveria bassiana (strain ARSEF 2860) TaxID=655819 RepID=J5J1M9_BEAB2|nr:uncharacterized protein BBA_10256 [Beauveria bassiana ARSEF 2860]EJP60798.1 hypothetical protein BBA_10256 [Beauveria bassiana ARSEF 2860]